MTCGSDIRCAVPRGNDSPDVQPDQPARKCPPAQPDGIRKLVQITSTRGPTRSIRNDYRHGRLLTAAGSTPGRPRHRVFGTPRPQPRRRAPRERPHIDEHRVRAFLPSVTTQARPSDGQIHRPADVTRARPALLEGVAQRHLPMCRSDQVTADGCACAVKRSMPGACTWAPIAAP